MESPKTGKKNRMLPKQTRTRNHFFYLLLFLLLLPTVSSAAEKEWPLTQDGPKDSALGESLFREDREELALTTNEPVYFVVGRNDGDTKARFQFGFKYRIFDADGIVVENVPWLEKFHFAYTQTSLWNLSADSSPFEDSSYRPSFFWEFKRPQIGKMPDFLRVGYEHESNGQGGDQSRSIDTLFILPVWETSMESRSLVVGTKFYVYTDQGRQNQDIEAYRGYADLIMRYGREDGWLMAGLWRHGTSNKNTVQLDLSYPIRKRIFARAGGYFYVQSFYGYGETLLTYNQREDLNIRFGFAIVR